LANVSEIVVRSALNSASTTTDMTPPGNFW
jgi:hypothetical protein